MWKRSIVSQQRLEETKYVVCYLYMLPYIIYVGYLCYTYILYFTYMDRYVKVNIFAFSTHILLDWANVNTAPKHVWFAFQKKAQYKGKDTKVKEVHVLFHGRSEAFNSHIITPKWV